MKPTIGIVGGGINGITVAWLAAANGYDVTLYERDDLVSQTSQSSTKLLHGGLRYLQYGRLKAVREALHERHWWLTHCPELTRQVPIVFPVYKGNLHDRLRLKMGLSIYDTLAGHHGLEPHTWFSATEVLQSLPGLREENLAGGYLFWEGQMDDRELGLWAANRATAYGARIHTETAVTRIDTDGHIHTAAGETASFDYVINAAGPWAGALLQQSELSSLYGLTLVRGSHLLIDASLQRGVIGAHPDDRRLFFILPYKDRTLIGTTEVRQDIEQPIACSEEEIDYLLKGYCSYFQARPKEIRIDSMFAGLRPLVKSSRPLGGISRSAKLELKHRLLTIWGGKWTTARLLAHKALRSLPGLENTLLPERA